MPVADWALRILHWWWEANTHQTMSFDLELAQTQLSSSLTHSSGCWKAIIYDRFRQKFLACQSHPAGASQAQFLPQDKLNFSSAHFQSRKSSKIHPLLPQGLTDGLVWKLPVKSEKWEVMMARFLYSFLSQMESMGSEDNESLREQASPILCGVAGWRLISGWSACFNYADDPIKTQSLLNAPPKRGWLTLQWDETLNYPPGERFHILSSSAGKDWFLHYQSFPTHTDGFPDPSL